MKPIKLVKVVKDNDYHYTRLTLRTNADRTGFDLKIETGWSAKFTKDDKESCLQFECKNMSRGGMELFINVAQGMIGTPIQSEVDAMLASK